jgi:hypothetical protein
MERKHIPNPGGTPKNLQLFKKGTSGNPGGTTKAVREVRDLCRKMNPAACAKLEEILKTETDNAVVLAAIKIIFARSIGKEREAETLYHKTQTESYGQIDIKTLSDEQLLRIQRIVTEPLP